MPRNGSGTYSLPAGNPVVTGTTISSTTHNNTMSDVATALTNSLAKDGQTTPTANLPMGGFKFTGMGTGSASTDSATLGQIQAQAYIYLNSVSGTDTITASTSPVTTSYAAGQTFRFVAAGANTGAVTININSLGAKSITKNGSTALVSGDIASGGVYQVTYDGTQFQITNPGINIGYGSVTQDKIASSAITLINDFRLTLTSGTPVTTSDVTGATTVYCCPYKGNRIALYDGSSRWNLRTSAEFSLALGTLTSGRPYDVFCYDNSGTPTLEFTSWTNDTTRATALTYQDGVLVKSGATTRRYLGTFYTTSTTQTEDSAAKRFLWNYYHRVLRPMEKYDSTATWSYTTDTYRQANAAAANQLDYVCGVAEDAVEAFVQSNASNTSPAVNIYTAIGVDSTSATSGLSPRTEIINNGAIYCVQASYRGIPGVGRHFLAWLERSEATGTTTWSGTNSPLKSGIIGSVFA